VTTVAIIDYGGGNVASVRFALDRLGARSVVTQDVGEIAAAGHVILPGVGAAPEGMRRLGAAGLDRLIPALRQPLLGICLGMQLLCEGSEEGSTTCLGIFAGRVARLRPSSDQPVPHMGWNQVDACRASPLLVGIGSGDYAYFVHSYALPVSTETVAATEYGGCFAAVVSRGNFHGVQWHPERSAATGARLLANFLSLGG